VSSKELSSKDLSSVDASVASTTETPETSNTSITLSLKLPDYSPDDSIESSSDGGYHPSLMMSYCPPPADKKEGPLPQQTKEE